MVYIIGNRATSFFYPHIIFTHCRRWHGFFDPVKCKFLRGVWFKFRSETIFYSEMIPIEPEPGNAGAGNKKLIKRVSVLPKLFFLKLSLLWLTLNGRSVALVFITKNGREFFTPNHFPKNTGLNSMLNNFKQSNLMLHFTGSPF